MRCTLRDSSETLNAEPAIQIDPRGEERRFILQSESPQFPKAKRTGLLGWQVSNLDGQVLESLGDRAFHEKYEVVIDVPEPSKS